MEVIYEIVVHTSLTKFQSCSTCRTSDINSGREFLEFLEFFPQSFCKKYILLPDKKQNTILFSLGSFKILTFFPEAQSVSTKLEMYKFS